MSLIPFNLFFCGSFSGRFIQRHLHVFLFVSLCISLCLSSCLQGRQGGVEIDPWEDADYSIYKVIDRFGFMQYVCPFFSLSFKFLLILEVGWWSQFLMVCFIYLLCSEDELPAPTTHEEKVKKHKPLLYCSCFNNERQQSKSFFFLFFY